MTLTPGKANEVKLAEAFIENLGSNIIQVVDEEITVSEKQQKLLELFQKNANTMTIARAALGSKWRTLSAETRLDFANAFTDYLVKKIRKAI
jgi:ABC-type transporter MlaC component